MNFSNLKLVFGFLILIFLYLNFSSPDKVVVDSSGNISGLINNLRETIQGNGFWEKQLQVAKSDLEWELSEPKRQAELDNELNQIMKETDESMEDMYREFPDMRPSKAETQAEKLRDRADEIEQQELDRELELMRQEAIIELKHIIPAIKEKLGK